MITGDIVYDRGRISEYREKFWPIYNADEASPSQGAPLLAVDALPGRAGQPRHRDPRPGQVPRRPGLLPLLGPAAERARSARKGAPHVPRLDGPEANKKAFLEAAGRTIPRMANFSFDYGNAHWTVLDANPYVDWTDRELRAWVERDLAAARTATWRFVGFHQPGFNSARKHFDEQNMRLLADVFEAGSVDVVFSGHVHNYQRTYPLRFAVERGRDGKPIRNKELRRTAAGRSTSRSTAPPGPAPEGVIYLVTGAGGSQPVQPRAAGRPRHLARVHPQVRLQGPLAHRRRRRRIEARPSARSRSAERSSIASS